MTMIRTLLLILFTSFLFTSCGTRPTYPVIPREKAMHLDAILEMKVKIVFDGLMHSRDPHVTHLVEVEIIRGPTEVVGVIMTLPYDSYNTGAKPPHAGKTVTLAPSEWVKRSAKSFGRRGN
ncbi:MAG: hypothetical protein HRU15_15485 [Planctomycetes bacterium]|nr:hypothetical protein [Planctomycetota bacterium]